MVIPQKSVPSTRPMSVRISPIRNLRYGPGSTRRSDITSTSFIRPSAGSFTNKYSIAEARTTSSTADDASTVNPDDFPYLREFSKRLSTLKAEPLHKRRSPLHTSGTSSRTYSSSSVSTTHRASYYRPVPRGEQERFYEPVRRFFCQMEEKYALKRKILILLAILVAIFVLVMFFY